MVTGSTEQNGRHDADKRCVYLDNAATSYPKPQCVVDAVRASLGESLTVARSTHLASFRGDEVLKRCRVKLARFFGAKAPEEMIYTYSATDGLNIVINGLVKPGSHVIVSPLEHHSVMRPLHHMRVDSGVSWDVLPTGPDAIIDPSSIKGVLRGNTSCVIINWVSNVTGTVQPVQEIGKVVADLGLPYIVDAAQATGTHPVDVQAIGCTAMAQPAHKALMSLPGMGVLYINRDVDIPSWRVGGTGYRSDLLMQPDDRPVRYESGTVNVPGVVGLDAAMDWFDEVGIANIRDHCAEMVRLLIEGLADTERITVIGPSPDVERGFVVSFIMDDRQGSPVDPMVISQILAEQYNISTRAGLHCSPPAHHKFGTYDRGGTVRFSVSYFTSADDVVYTLGAVRAIVTELG